MNKVLKIILVIFSLSFVLIMIFSSTKDSSDKAYEALSMNLSRENFGEIESIIEYGDESVIAAHYPVFDKDTIDTNTRTTILQYIIKFNEVVRDLYLEDDNYKAELNIHYDIYSNGGNIISIKFMIEEILPHYDYPNLEILTMVYDFHNEIRIDLNNIVNNGFLERVSEITKNYFQEHEQYVNYTNTEDFQEAFSPNLKNYSNFILSKNYINFIFQQSEAFPGFLGIPEISIPYDAIRSFMKAEFINYGFQATTLPVAKNYNNKIDELEGIEVMKLDSQMPMVALTFDDGPSQSATIPILNTLKEYNSVATFFLLGNRVSDHRDIVKEMISSGNEIGNHSYNHKQLTTLTPKELEKQIDQTQNAILEVIGATPDIMRPTYGSYNEELQSKMNLPMILWSIDTEDWKSQNPEKIATHVLENIQDGDIVLMHDIFESTARAVEIMVPELIDRGFQLVTVSQLYESSGETLQVGNIYRHNKTKRSSER